jgi:hypothetical protein
MNNEGKAERLCPWSGLAANECGGESVTHLSQTDTEDHITWHLKECVRLGQIIEVEPGLYALPEDVDADGNFKKGDGL